MPNKLVKKITVKAVLGSPGARRDLVPEKGHKNIMRVIGIATGLERGETQYGEFSKILGRFEATNLITGEVFHSGCLIMPEIVNTATAAAVEMAERGAAVKFAFDIGIQKPTDPESTVSYEWTAEPLMDGLGDELAEMKKSLPALAAPKPVKIEKK